MVRLYQKYVSGSGFQKFFLLRVSMTIAMLKGKIRVTKKKYRNSNLLAIYGLFKIQPDALNTIATSINVVIYS